MKVSVNRNLEADSCKWKKKPHLNQRLYVDRLHPLLENNKARFEDDLGTSMKES